MKNLDYEQYAIEAIRQFGKQLMEDAEVLVPSSGLRTDLTIWIRIPCQTDEIRIPTMDVTQEFIPPEPEKLFYGVKDGA